MGVLLALGTLALVLAGTAASGLFSPVRVANDTLIYAGAADPTYLDPTLVSDGESFRVTAQIFESLVSLKPGSTVVAPGLASKYGSTNGKDWKFTLRKGVKFQDKTPFNAAAVCFNFNRQYNYSGPFQDASATYYWQTVFGGFHHNADPSLGASLYKGCTARGKYTAIIHLSKRSSSFLPALVISSFAIQSPTAIKKYGGNKGELVGGVFKATGTYAFSHPTGTGPFQFESWKIGESVVLKRFTGYWGKKAKLARIIIRPIANNTARVQALQTGEIYGAGPDPAAGRSDDPEQQQPEADQPALVQRRVRRIPPGTRLADGRPQGPAGGCIWSRSRRRRQLVLCQPRTGGDRVPAADAVRLDEQGEEVPVRPGQGANAAQLIELQSAVQGRLLVPDGRLPPVHARPEAELRGVRSEPREGRLQRRAPQRAVAARLRREGQRRLSRRHQHDRLDR